MRKQLGWFVVSVMALGLMPTGVAASAEPQVAITISPSTAGNTAVKAGQTILVSGTAPSGPILGATLIAVEEGGTTSEEEVPGWILNRAGGDGDDFLTNNAGTISGQLTLPCIFREPLDTCQTVHGIPRKALLEIEIGGETAQSLPLRVDFTRPVIEGYKLVAPNIILIEFSEPVRNADGDSPFDWEVTSPSRTPARVDGPTPSDCIYAPSEDATAGTTGCTRRITIQEVGEDEPPFVSFTPALIRKAYEDFASNSMFRTSGSPSSRALDRLAPKAPRITAIAGRTSNDVIANERSPRVSVSGLSGGHSAQLFAETDGISGLSDGDEELGPRVAGSGGNATLDLSNASEGRTTLYAVAFDQALNRSPSGNGTYILDTIVPSALSAEPVDNNFIQVVFTEPVYGTGNIGDWKVGNGAYPVVGVVGEGNSRLLRVSGVPSGTTVTYSPITGARLVDAAGNVLGSFTKTTTTAQPGSSGSTGGSGTTTSPSPSPSTTPTSTPGSGSGGTPTPGPTQTPTPAPSPTPTQTPGEPQEDLQARAAEDDAAVGACQDVAVTFSRNGQPVAGENVDVSLAEGLEFCDGTEGRHGEAFTDSSGTAVFRILSRTTRTISILAWHDKDDDDLADSNEKRKSVELTWAFDGARSLTIKGKLQVMRGKKIRLHGTVTAVMRRCEVDTAIEIVRQRGRGIKVIDAVFSRADGSFSKRVRVTKTGTYFARAQSIGGCDEAYSQGLLVKVRRKH